MSVDTEEEFDWSMPRRRDANSVTAVRVLPVAHARLRSYGVKPAYLVDYPVASNPMSVEVLRRFLDDGECTLGAQLHAWVNPPFDEAVNVANSFPGNLPRALERAKMLALTERITESFGRRPIVYRAGRYGVGPNSEALLDELGYRVDCSVRPFFDYAEEKGPSFWSTPTQPYWTGPERRLLEVPMTTVFIGGLRRLGGPLFRLSGYIPLMRGAMARTRLLNRVALTPEGMPLCEALRGLRALMAKGTRLFSISFHSPSVEPGHTPFVRDEADLKQLYAWFDGVFDYFARVGVEPATVEDVLGAAIESRQAKLAGQRTDRVAAGLLATGPVAQG